MGQGVVMGTKENGLPVGKLFFVVEGPPPRAWLIPGNQPDAKLINPNVDPPWTVNMQTRTWEPPAGASAQVPTSTSPPGTEVMTTLINASRVAERVAIVAGAAVFIGLIWGAFFKAPAGRLI